MSVIVNLIHQRKLFGESRKGSYCSLANHQCVRIFDTKQRGHGAFPWPRNAPNLQVVKIKNRAGNTTAKRLLIIQQSKDDGDRQGKTQSTVWRMSLSPAKKNIMQTVASNLDGDATMQLHHLCHRKKNCCNGIGVQQRSPDRPSTE